MPPMAMRYLASRMLSAPFARRMLVAKDRMRARIPGFLRMGRRLRSAEPSTDRVEAFRYRRGSLLITSQIPVDRWYDLIGSPALADAILQQAARP